MQSWIEIAESINFDHASHFVAVFGGKAGGVNAHRLHVVGFDFRAEAG